MTLFDGHPRTPLAPRGDLTSLLDEWTAPEPVRAWRVMVNGDHLGTVADRSVTGAGGRLERWEAFAGGNALHVPHPANSRVVATMAVLDNARRCGIRQAGRIEIEYVPVDPGAGTLT